MAEPIQSKRARKRQHEENLIRLKERKAKYGIDPPLSLLNEIDHEEECIAKLDQEIREDLRLLSPLPPQRYGRFIGRKGSLDKVFAALEDPEAHWIIAIDGIGGVGKTALAREVVNRSLEAGDFYAVVWESAKPEEFTGGGTQEQFTADIDFDNLLDLIGRKLGYFEVASKRTIEEKRKLVRYILGNERYLVVVDNLETLGGYRDLVNNLGGMFTRSKAILTTRKKVAEFRHIYSVSLGGMERDESIEFIRSVAGERGEAGDVIRLADEATLERIHAATGGLPLAMELVVGQATRSSLEAVLERLQTVNFQAIERPDSAEDVYNQFFKFIYWDAWKQLSDEAKTLLIGLGTFDLAEGADEEELAIVSGLGVTILGDVAGELIGHSLIHRSIRDVQPIFFLHPLTHRFVQSDLVRA
jgi:hypothetical protein